MALWVRFAGRSVGPMMGKFRKKKLRQVALVLHLLVSTVSICLYLLLDAVHVRVKTPDTPTLHLHTQRTIHHGDLVKFNNEK